MRTTFIIAVLLFSLPAFSQVGIKKVHGYYRYVYPGIRKVQFNEQGNPVEEPPDIRKDYFIYIETATRSKPLFQYMIIEGIRYGVRIDSVSVLPVVIQRDLVAGKAINDTLVPATQNSVYRLIPVLLKQTKKPSPSTVPPQLILVSKKGKKNIQKTTHRLTEIPSLMMP